MSIELLFKLLLLAFDKKLLYWSFIVVPTPRVELTFLALVTSVFLVVLGDWTELCSRSLLNLRELFTEGYLVRNGDMTFLVAGLFCCCITIIYCYC